MKPVDPRLLRHASATRTFLVASVLLGTLGAALVIAQAMLVADVIVTAFQHHGPITTPLTLLAVVSILRGLVSWGTEVAAHRASARVKSQLREQLLDRATHLGPTWLARQRSGELVTLATRGVDALDDYFARYLPQLALAIIVPATVIARILLSDWLSAVIIVLTLPLIPVFMILIGLATQSQMDRQWRTLGRLSHHFLDVVAGLPTLKVFGRAKAQTETIRKTTDQYRRATMRTLRLAFVSSFALELLATISVALVAVSIGMRLVDGSLDLYTGLLVLVLAPEAYLPIRQVGTHYHASVEGLAAAEQIFAVLETPAPTPGTHPAPSTFDLTLTNLTVTHAPALRDINLHLPQGEILAITGPSGTGKTTLLSTLLGFTTPTTGTIRINDNNLTDLTPTSWHSRIAWVPQHPHLFAGTIADNVRLASPNATPSELNQALKNAHAWDFVESLPLGIKTPLGENGEGLSAGQRQRLALARAFLADRPLVLLDEPTANLDGASEAAIVDAIRTLAHGRTVILTAHRPALLALATRHLALTATPDEATANAPRLSLPLAREGVARGGVVAAGAVKARNRGSGVERAPRESPLFRSRPQSDHPPPPPPPPPAPPPPPPPPPPPLFKQKTAYEIPGSDWSSDVCSSDLRPRTTPTTPTPTPTTPTPTPTLPPRP